MQLLGVLRVPVDLCDRLDAGGDERVALPRPDRVMRHPDRLERRGAEAVDRRAGHARRQPGQQRRAPGQVHALPLLREPTADHDVDDLRTVEFRDLFQRGIDRERDEVVRACVDEGALAGPPDRGSYRRDDDRVRQTRSPFHVRPARLSLARDYENALTSVSARPMMSFWIWLVPSYKVVTRASLRYFPTGYSSTYPYPPWT